MIEVKTFFDPVTFTAQHVVSDSQSRQAVIIDPVLDFNPASGAITTESADAILQYGQENQLCFSWVLETHAHADHLSASDYLAKKAGTKIAIGAGITQVQKYFAPVFDFEPGFPIDGSQFDRLLVNGDEIKLGGLLIKIIATPGHTPACISFHIENMVFVGDTLFMPDFGSARADFPGGDAKTLYGSIQKLFALAEDTVVYLCHDYKAPGRDVFAWQTTIGEQKQHNIHLKDQRSEAEFVAMRTERDKGLGLPKLILPSLQINLRAGKLPPPEKNGISYLKLPLNQF